MVLRGMIQQEAFDRFYLKGKERTRPIHLGQHSPASFRMTSLTSHILVPGSWYVETTYLLDEACTIT